MKKTNLGLVEYAKHQLGKPYWWGTFGQISTNSLYKQLKDRHPTQYTSNDFLNQLGVKVHDCSGLIKGYLFSDEKENYKSSLYNVVIDCNIVYNMCIDKGTIDTLLEIPGILVFLPGHVGIYIGNGEVIEARGHAYGVVTTKLKNRPWTHWGKCRYIDYIEKSGDDEMIEKLKQEFGEENVEKALRKLILAVNNNSNPSDWAKEDFEKAKEIGITDGSNPKMFATREETAIMIKRLVDKLN